MNKTLSFVRLDYITVKPYLTLKNLIIFCGVAFLMILGSSNPVSAIGMLMAYAALYVTYPFAVGEKNGIDALYTTLAISRKTVVSGRYCFALLVDAAAALLACGFAAAIMAVMQKPFSAAESFAAAGGMLLLFSFIQAIQLPIYFKLGYAKAKLAAYLPFIGVAALFALFAASLKGNASAAQMDGFAQCLAAHPYSALLLVVLVWLGVLYASYRISLALYSKRDF